MNINSMFNFIKEVNWKTELFQVNKKKRVLNSK